jgi:2-polyprenyl-6-methoxyphenol hydroxylase-like FAD-dependent oxidoreductase
LWLSFDHLILSELALNSSTVPSRSVRIIGGSLGGLFAANLLYRAGWDVCVYERSPEELNGRGAGIVTHPELFEALQRCGVDVDDSIGVRVYSRVTLAQDGRVLGRLPMEQVLTAWGRLFEVLRRALPRNCYVNGVSALGVTDAEEGVHLSLSDGRTERVDLVVAADGIRSTLRHQLAPQTQPHYAGYIAWRGLVEELAISSATRTALFEHFAFCLPPGEQMLGYPVAGQGNSTTQGERRFNFVWYRPADEATTLADLLTDRTGHLHARGIAPQQIRPEVIATMRADAHRVLSAQFAELIDLTAQPFFQPIYDLASKQIVFGRTALLGDCAFVARPHCGMGVTKAAGDAMALVRALSEHPCVPSALVAYQTERLTFGNAVVDHARHLGAYMQAQILTPAERAMAERYHSPAAVMAETAVSRAFSIE